MNSASGSERPLIGRGDERVGHRAGLDVSASQNDIQQSLEQVGSIVHVERQRLLVEERDSSVQLA